MLEKILRVPWTARRSNQSILKEIIPEYSLEGLMLKVNFQYFGHLMWELTHWKRAWCWERSKAGGKGEDEMFGRHHWLNGHEFEQAVGAGDGQGSVVCCFRWVTKSQIWLSNWTELNSTRVATVEHKSQNHRRTFKPLCPQQCNLSLFQELTSILSLILIFLLLFLTIPT